MSNAAADRPLPATVLVVEDDLAFRVGVATSLAQGGHQVLECDTADTALRALADSAVDLVLTDLRLPGADGLELLQHCRRHDPDLPVLLMTGHGDIATAVAAIRQGAYDFIEKPFGRDRLLTSIERALRQRALALENRGLRRGMADGAVLAATLCGDSPSMRALRSLVLRIAPTPVDVLVIGETGTGKELVARALHDFSGRGGPFVPVNAAALPETLIESELFGHEAGAFSGATRARAGRIEHADGGTLFLDELQAMPGAVQAKLLRMLQEREVQRLGSNQARRVDVRVVAASNAELEPMVDAGAFRADLYYRLDVVSMRLPPLRERREDIPALFAHFCSVAAARFGRVLPADDAGLVHRLLAHRWPGNVRELRSAAERWVLGLAPLDAPAAAAGAGTLQGTLAGLEALLIEDALRRCGGEVEAASRELAISPATLYRKLKAHGLALPARRDAGRP